MGPTAINFNGQLLPNLPEPLALAQRAALYGDGLFESIRAFDGQLPFWHLHWERLSHGLSVLGIELSRVWDSDYFQKEIRRFSPPYARIRLSVWRSPGGLYFPTDNAPQYLVTAEPMQAGGFEWSESGIEVCLCETVRLPLDGLSGLKTIGATRYVAAAREARAKAADDAIVLNAHGRVCEAAGSNVIWVKGDTVFVPPPFDGQINGTFQKLLCALLRQDGWEVREKPCWPDDLKEADEVFLTNAVRGIRWVRKFEGAEYSCVKSRHFNYLMEKYLEKALSSK
jgi:branched-chain amino acid aminotransferase